MAREKEYVITATLVNRRTGERRAVHSSRDSKYTVFGGKAKWVDDDIDVDIAYCLVGLEFVNPRYRVENVSDMEELMRYRMLYADFFPDWLIKSDKDEALIWENYNDH